MLFLFGPPGCGKSTVADTLLHIAGSYGATLSAEHVVGDSNQHRAWLARLDRKRLVRINEMPSKGAWRTSDLLSLVSGEMITANHMRRDPFDFPALALRCALPATMRHSHQAVPGTGGGSVRLTAGTRQINPTRRSAISSAGNQDVSLRGYWQGRLMSLQCRQR